MDRLIIIKTKILEQTEAHTVIEITFRDTKGDLWVGEFLAKKSLLNELHKTPLIKKELIEKRQNE